MNRISWCPQFICKELSDNTWAFLKLVDKAKCTSKNGQCFKAQHRDHIWVPYCDTVVFFVKCNKQKYHFSKTHFFLLLKNYKMHFFTPNIYPLQTDHLPGIFLLLFKDLLAILLFMLTLLNLHIRCRW